MGRHLRSGHPLCLSMDFTILKRTVITSINVLYPSIDSDTTIDSITECNH